ncbi:TetR/AcrR family transcriptional regulator [Aquimarina sp. MMG015]|uniref:TetR/AcrR family transcriptional regulator n=1 Tax=unclassified Aquimarina TaxID=2627091 RepID=UPI000E4A2431|nr:TetR/AcrR family transcriptional regulator [Aquimarina sp. AD1]AXT55235.1 TetR/AcrR family transcriptional regulator [Aquimarina sp. AD1]MBQ4802197.1 TetR/AcrR family transcriptional regulator [Aquimarina sp. MMG015]RKN07484.1 TetR family transcriptional regulator [Aquimarina sp. AD1]
MRVKDEHKREAIIAHTLDIVSEKGFAGIKMSTLANRIGISVSTLYVYYKNKDDLIVSIASELITNITKNSVQDITEDIPFKLRMKAVWLYWINFSINHSKEMNFITQVKKSPYYEKIPTAIIETKNRIGTNLFELGKKEGLIRDIDNEVLEATIGALLYETVNLIINKKIQLNKKDTDMMFSFVWNAIKS